MAVTPVKQQTTPANPGLEVQELIILRDYYKFKPADSENSKKENAQKLKEYEDRLAPKKANLINLAYDASKKPNFDESLYSTDVFFDEHRRDVEPAIQKYKDKINYYQDKCPFQFKGNYLLARDMGMDVEFKQDGSPYGTPVHGQFGKAQAFYNDLWAKRNLPYTMDEYPILRDHWQKLLNERIELDKIRGPSQAELLAYHKYLQGPKPPGGYTLPPWITTPPPKKWVVVEYFCGAGVGGGNWCTKWVWQ
ncbi:hypothetical protein DAPPUDRAFT_109589 [Daphnia pulex]|uniref:Uncharacterized protein n=1 Tax=Daphnia pulex TaxID=6669 RepID=E9H3J6_DAPPU|nr:hypothetical protein DAPPUDRAFT_109589 [Daphnia pulex]|eukprot:EFX73691.1 hypothetical protein DAPPUDRAFT_109589 [Daphnia pulex]